MFTEGIASNLIDSDQESGKAVYGAHDKKIGSIEHVMIDKTSGEIAYAMLSFGGFLGIGKDHSDISESRLKGAPKHGTDSISVFDWKARHAEVNSYYGEQW